MNFIIWCVIFVSALFHALAGFGFPMISTSVLFTFLPAKEAMTYTILPAFFMNLAALYYALEKGEFFSLCKNYYNLAIFAIFGSYLGSYILIHFPSEIYKPLLSIVVAAFLLKDKFRLDFSGFIRQNLQISMILFGFFSGLIGGLVNGMVVILAILILELNLGKNHAVAVMNFAFLTNKIAQVVAFGINGEFGKNELMFSAVSVIICGFAMFLGLKFKDKIDDKIFKKILKFALAFLAILMFVQFLFGIFSEATSAF